jgi:hypothetical protein
VKAAIVTALAGMLIATATGATRLEEIVSRHTAARGGAAAIEAQQTVAIDVEITEPGFKVRGTWLGDRTGAMRVDIFDDGRRVYTESWRDGIAWQRTADGTVSTSSKAGAQALEHGLELPTNLHGLHELAAPRARLELRPDEPVDGHVHHVVRVTLEDGFVIEYLIDPRTWMIVRSRTRRALHPDVDPRPTVIESRYADFRETGGVLRPFASEDVDLSTGEVLARVRVLDVRGNLPLAPERFDRPSTGTED